MLKQRGNSLVQVRYSRYSTFTFVSSTYTCWVFGPQIRSLVASFMAIPDFDETFPTLTSVTKTE
jgi:hypothetical protein